MKIAAVAAAALAMLVSCDEKEEKAPLTLDGKNVYTPAVVDFGVQLKMTSFYAISFFVGNSSHAAIGITASSLLGKSEGALEHFLRGIAEVILPVFTIFSTEFHEISGNVVSLECKLSRLCIEKSSELFQEYLHLRRFIINVVSEADVHFSIVEVLHLNCLESSDF